MDKSLYVNIPISLYEKLRKYCFSQNKKKKEVVIDALTSYLSSGNRPIDLSTAPTTRISTSSAKSSTQVVHKDKKDMPFEL